MQDNCSFLNTVLNNNVSGSTAEQILYMLQGVLQAPYRCCATSSYIQAVSADHQIFLASNLNMQREIRMTSVAHTWTVGRSTNCAIAAPDPSISRCHVVIHYAADGGFSITDIGSKNGTWVNHQRLAPKIPFPIQDGDLLRLGKLEVEFFTLSSHHLALERLQQPYLGKRKIEEVVG